MNSIPTSDNAINYMDGLTVEWITIRDNEPTNTNTIGFEQFLRTKMNSTMANNIIIGLSKCNCCKRHCNDKPYSLECQKVDIEYNEYSNDHCKCNCRHQSRWLCRSF